MKIEFKTESAAFCDPHTGEEDDFIKRAECDKIIKDILLKIQLGYTYGPVIDYNGNVIGRWEL